MKQQTSSKSWKEYDKAVYCHPAYLIYMQSTSCKMSGWMKHTLESRLPGEISNNLRYADDTTPMAESKELKSLLRKVKEKSENVGLKINIQKTKILSSSPITSWQIDWETMGKLTIFLGSKITADGDCSHEIKRQLLLGRKVMTSLDSILKSRHYYANNGPSSQSCGFSSSHVWMWEFDYKESWVLKNLCFELWCWRRLLRVLWTARRSNQSILKETSPDYSLEGLMLKLQYFGHLM